MTKKRSQASIIPGENLMQAFASTTSKASFMVLVLQDFGFFVSA